MSSDLLEKMRRNPMGDWRIRDVDPMLNCVIRRPAKF
jgi:hypothetical protein